jgi:hypothetical protein
MTRILLQTRETGRGVDAQAGLDGAQLMAARRDLSERESLSVVVLG